MSRLACTPVTLPIRAQRHHVSTLAKPQLSRESGEADDSRLRVDVDKSLSSKTVRRTMLVAPSVAEHRESPLVRVTSHARRCRLTTSRGKLVPTVPSNSRHAGLTHTAVFMRPSEHGHSDRHGFP